MWAQARLAVGEVGLGVKEMPAPHRLDVTAQPSGWQHNVIMMIRMDLCDILIIIS